MCLFLDRIFPLKNLSMNTQIKGWKILINDIVYEITEIKIIISQSADSIFVKSEWV